MTAFYMFRAVYMTFHGEFRGRTRQAHHLHESPASMTVPLRILAVGVGGGRVRRDRQGAHVRPRHQLFEHFLHPVAPALEVEHAPVLAVEWVLIVISVAVAVGGILLARRFYWGPEAFQRPTRPRRTLPHPLLHRRQQVLRGRALRRHRGAPAPWVWRQGSCDSTRASSTVGQRDAPRDAWDARSSPGFFDLNVVDGLVNLVAGFYGGRAASCGGAERASCSTPWSWPWASCCWSRRRCG